MGLKNKKYKLINMKSLSQHITEKLVINKNSSYNTRKYNYIPKTYEELDDLIVKLIDERGNEADLNDIDTSKITTMESLFRNYQDFNGDISEWDVSNVTNMSQMFESCYKFNGDISKWDVSNVTKMPGMFFEAKSFNQDISKWDVSNVIYASMMFCDAESFNQPIGNWNVSSMEYFNMMFNKAKSFNQDLSKWKFHKNHKKPKDGPFDDCPIKEEYKPYIKN